MLYRSIDVARASTALLFAVTVTACDRAPASLGPDMADHGGHAAFAQNPNTENSPEVHKWLAGLRSATAAFHEFGTANSAGYDAQITGCMELAGTGGMGFHYGDTDLIDGVVEEFKPELLLYEPQKNGRLRLVAVEYIVPFTLWTEPDPPVLHGLTFHPNSQFQVWALHAWVWQHNKAGIFSDWNPAISCAHA